MRRRREFPAQDSVVAVTEGVQRQIALMQQMAQYPQPDNTAPLLRRMRGISAAAQRDWHAVNERLERQMIVAVEREDVSRLVRELAACAAFFETLAVWWQAVPLDSAAVWTARLAKGGHALRQMTGNLSALWQAGAFEAELAVLEEVRREAAVQWGQEARRLRGNALQTAAGFRHGCAALAQVGDTVAWIALKNR